MKLTAAQMIRCHNLVALDKGYTGRIWRTKAKRKAVEQVASAFEDWVRLYPDVKPSNWQLTMFCGEKYGSVILIAIISGIISWCVGMLLDYLWELWIEEKSKTEH